MKRWLPNVRRAGLGSCPPRGARRRRACRRGSRARPSSGCASRPPLLLDDRFRTGHRCRCPRGDGSASPALKNVISAPPAQVAPSLTSFVTCQRTRRAVTGGAARTCVRPGPLARRAGRGSWPPPCRPASMNVSCDAATFAGIVAIDMAKRADRTGRRSRTRRTCRSLSRSRQTRCRARRRPDGPPGSRPGKLLGRGDDLRGGQGRKPHERAIPEGPAVAQYTGQWPETERSERSSSSSMILSCMSGVRHCSPSRGGVYGAVIRAASLSWLLPVSTSIPYNCAGGTQATERSPRLCTFSGEDLLHHATFHVGQPVVAARSGGR